MEAEPKARFDELMARCYADGIDSLTQEELDWLVEALAGEGFVIPRLVIRRPSAFVIVKDFS